MFLNQFRWQLRRNGPLLGLFAGLVLVATTLPMFSAFFNSREFIQEAMNPNSFYGGVQSAVLTLTIAYGLSYALILLTACLLVQRLFGYLHNRASVDLVHSQPQTRLSLFGSLASTGVVVLLVLSLTFGLSFLLARTYIPLTYWNLLSPLAFKYMVGLFSMGLANFFFLVPAYLLLGRSFDAFLFGMGTQAFIPALLIGIRSYVALTIPLIERNLSRIFQTSYFLVTPVTGPLIFSNEWIRALYWFLFALLFALLSAFLFVQRRSELAEQSTSFCWPYYPMRFLVDFLGAMLGAGIATGVVKVNYLLGVRMNSAAEAESPTQAALSILPYMVIGAIVGALLVHLAYELLFQRGNRRWASSFAALLAPLLLFGLFYASLSYDIFGLVSRPLKQNLERPLYIQRGVNSDMKVEITDIADKTRLLELEKQNIIEARKFKPYTIYVSPELVNNKLNRMFGGDPEDEKADKIHSSILEMGKQILTYRHGDGPLSFERNLLLPSPVALEQKNGDFKDPALRYFFATKDRYSAIIYVRKDGKSLNLVDQGRLRIFDEIKGKKLSLRSDALWVGPYLVDYLSGSHLNTPESQWQRLGLETLKQVEQAGSKPAYLRIYSYRPTERFLEALKQIRAKDAELIKLEKSGKNNVDSFKPRDENDIPEILKGTPFDSSSPDYLLRFHPNEELKVGERANDAFVVTQLIPLDPKVAEELNGYVSHRKNDNPFELSAVHEAINFCIFNQFLPTIK